MKERNIELIRELTNKEEQVPISVKLKKSLNDEINTLAKKSVLTKNELLNMVIEIGLEELVEAGVLKKEEKEI